MADTQNSLPYLRLQILKHPKLFREDARWNGAFTKIDNRIAEREIFLLLSTELEFLAEVADADGGMIEGKRLIAPDYAIL